MLTKDELSQIENLFDKLDNRDDFRKVAKLYKSAQTWWQIESGRKYRVGDVVMFKTKAGDKITGKIERINQKSIRVLSDNGEQWKVAPSLIKENLTKENDNA